MGDGGITEECEDVYADEIADVISAESEVSIGNVNWDCRITVAISAGSGRSVCVDINNDGPSSDKDIALDGDKTSAGLCFSTGAAPSEAGRGHEAVLCRQSMSMLHLGHWTSLACQPHLQMEPSENINSINVPLSQGYGSTVSTLVGRSTAQYSGVNVAPEPPQARRDLLSL